MRHLCKGITLAAAVLACATISPAQQASTAQQPADKQAQEQAERDRRQAERDAKAKEKGERKEPGSRCARWKRGKA